MSSQAKSLICIFCRLLFLGSLPDLLELGRSDNFTLATDSEARQLKLVRHFIRVDDMLVQRVSVVVESQVFENLLVAAVRFTG